MKEYKQHEYGKFLPKMQDDEFEKLCEDIKQNGLVFPIWLYHNEILDGWHRYQACKKVGVEGKFEEYKGDSPITFVASTSIRRNLNATQRACLAANLKFKFEEEAKNRKISKLKQNTVSKNFTNGEEPTEEDITNAIINAKTEYTGSKGKSTKAAAVITGANEQYVYEVEKIKEEYPEKFDEMLEGKVTLQDVKKELKKEQRLEELEQIKEKIEKENLTITDKFDTVVIDPPWPYDREYDPEVSRVANPYPEMSIKDIQAIELPLKDNGVLFLWTTHQFLPYAFQLIDGWNLKYKGTVVWDKEKMGMGANIRMQCEFCLIAFKGTPKVLGASERDIIREARREHSRKPDSFYKFVERYTIGSKLDYFSREDREGWQTYGAETAKFNKEENQ